MEHLLELCKARFSEEEMQRLMKAYEFAKKSAREAGADRAASHTLPIP